MRFVVALGGNAISRRGEDITVDNQRRNLRAACRTLVDCARGHELVITHGNGPQVGLLALQNAAYEALAPYPLDVLGAETQGMIGYLIEIEMRNVMANAEYLTTVLTLTEVSLDDPAFARPTKFVGPVYDDDAAMRIGAQTGWQFARDGASLRRVVASPQPRRVVQVDSCRRLLAGGHIVVAAGGGGIPVARDRNGELVGVEAVIDKDASSAVLAANLDADVLVMATDAAAVCLDWGTPDERALRRVGTVELGRHEFADGSMGPKATAARRFVEATGHRAVIGRLDDLPALLDGSAGTSIVPGEGGEDCY
ncbi:MAG: carbamate kinase [Micrococcales bacterium]|nr:carbamate kinase [Micrococcales bacterium]